MGNFKERLTAALFSGIAIFSTFNGRLDVATLAVLSASATITNTRKQEDPQQAAPSYTLPPANTAFIAKPVTPKTIILIDGDNISIEAQTQRYWVDYSKILNDRSGDEVVEAIFFTGFKHTNDSPYARFLEKIAHYGFHVAGNPRNKSNRDLAIQLKLAESAHDEDIANILLMSGDGDFCEVVDYAKKHGKYVEVMGFPSSSSYELRLTASEWIDITTLDVCIPKSEAYNKPTKPRLHAV